MGSRLNNKRRMRRPNEPNWWLGYLENYNVITDGAWIKEMDKRELEPETFEQEKSAPSPPPPLQQSDLLKPLYVDIMENGLAHASANWGKKREFSDESYSSKDDTFDADVIIVGAGMAGLVAAYELEKADVSVLLLEHTTRVGGRVLTFGEKDGLAKGLLGEAGAMRLPCDATVKYCDMTHFLTAFYMKEFELKKVAFNNYSCNSWYSFYDEKPIRIKDWTQPQFDNLWPDWNKNIDSGKYKQQINDIDTYYKCTTIVVTDQLRKWLNVETKDKDDKEIQREKSEAWGLWIYIWSQFTLEGFLKSTYEAVVAQIKEAIKQLKQKEKEEGWLGHLDWPDTLDWESDLTDLQYLLPWPDVAVRGYSVFSYTEQLDQSLVQFLRDQLGDWWSKNMHRIKGGMSKLPEEFASRIRAKASDKIRFNHKVNVITYTYDDTNPANDHVEISGYFSSSKRPFPTVRGKAVLVTTPINILRQITMKSSCEHCPPPKEYYQAIENIFTAPSTKIFLQTKTRFWEDGEDSIKGGFSKTNLPVGQIHYPSNTDQNLNGVTEKGLLLIYTWKAEASLFAALDPDTAVREAVEQVATIHEEITEQFEVGLVHAWYNQPNTLGAYGLLKPNQFQQVKWLWMPMYNVYFANETLSTSTGWIQGALESGLRAAYQYYVRYVKVVPEP